MLSGLLWRFHSPRYHHLYRVGVPTTSLGPARSIPSSICPMWDVRYHYLRVLPRCFVRLALALFSAASLPPSPPERFMQNPRYPSRSMSCTMFRALSYLLTFCHNPSDPFPMYLPPWLLPCVSLTVLITIYDRCSVSIYTDPTCMAQLPSYLF